MSERELETFKFFLLSAYSVLRYRTAYLSFGGLLMALRGNYQYLSELVIGENVYLMIKHT